MDVRTQAVPAAPPSARRTLSTLFAANFVLGTAETLVIGLLVVISGDLGVSVPAAGGLVTAYAVGLAAGGPLLTMATVRLDRRTVVRGSVAVFVVGNLLAVVTADYLTFLVARGVTGALHGLFLATAFTVATAVVPREAAGRAMAAILLGNTLAGAFGAPLGTALGQVAGWRGAFVAVAALGALVLAACWFLVPSLPGASADDAGRGQLRNAFAPRVLALLVVCFLVFAASCAAWSYVVPFLGEVTGVSGAMVGVYLMIYGAATAAGAYVGGRLADWDASRALVLGLTGLTLSLVALWFLGSSPVMVALILALLGLCTMGMAPSLQHRVVGLAGPGAPLAQSLPASAANVGVATGAAVGGLAITGFGVPAAVAVGALIGAVAIPVAMATSRLRPVRE
ncbi:MFS transporter [Promicromonospora sp. NPDC060271]|uniref:MFS transporter n=1 Tax=Promicromonospora sp. NPDC060271 TaxID=3347089 RepID=UPI00365C67CA